MRSRLSALGLFLAVGMFTGCIVSPKPPDAARVNEAHALTDLGTVELRRGALDAAGAVFRLALELAPLPEALDGLGCVSFLRGDLDGAEQFYWGALELAPEYPQALGNLALLYEARGEREMARELYVRALRSEPRNFRARLNFAAFLHGENDRTLTQVARTELLKARAIAVHPLIEGNLARVNDIDRSSYE